MKKLNRIVFALCALGALTSVAAAQEAQQLMDKMAGVYKHRFMSGVVVPGKPDEPYQAEDVIEIVPYDADHVYVNVHLDFYNGHQCGIAGMAKYERGEFVYRGHELEPEGFPQCVLRVGVDNGKLRLTDRIGEEGVRTCGGYCGVRGSLTYDIGMDKRRSIRYMPRLKASREYRQAIEEMRKAEAPAR